MKIGDSIIPQQVLFNIFHGENNDKPEDLGAHFQTNPLSLQRSQRREG
jgi:hypothetical protein